MKLAIYNLISLVFIMASPFLVSAQVYQPYEWNEDRGLTSLTEEELQIPLYNIKTFKKYQYVYDANSKDLVLYTTTHNIIRANNDEALSKNNRIYISTARLIELVDLKARAITKSGKIINLDQSNIKELKGEDAAAGYKIFAIEGAEVGGEIEYYYTAKSTPSYFLSDFIQTSSPVKEAEISLSSVKNLEFDYKVYNHEALVSYDTAQGMNHYTLKAINVPKLLEEPFSAYKASRARLDFKLAYNTAKENKRLFTWGDAGQRIFSQISGFDKSENKALSKFINSVGIKELADTPIDALRKIEHTIKTKFSFDKKSSNTDIAHTLRNKFTNEVSFARLYAGICENLGITYELVLTCDRFDKKFDGDFDTWSFLDSYLIYLPETKQFLSPSAFTFRLGRIAPGFIDSEGLFIRIEEVQDFKFPVGYISKIPAPSYRQDFDNLNINVKFDQTLTQNIVDVTRSFSGFSADYYKTGTLVLNEERKDEMLETIIKYLAPDAAIEKLDLTAINSSYESWNKPFTINGTFKTNAYIEKAGNVVIFNIGGLIGPQSELYQEESRKTEIVNTNNRGYYRELVINIPEGYTVKNPEDIALKEEVKNGSKTIFIFESTYTLEGSILTVKIDEYYDQIYYPKEEFEPFRKVINAAADWNKVQLVLQKK